MSKCYEIIAEYEKTRSKGDKHLDVDYISTTLNGISKIKQVAIN